VLSALGSCRNMVVLRGKATGSPYVATYKRAPSSRKHSNYLGFGYEIYILYSTDLAAGQVQGCVPVVVQQGEVSLGPVQKNGCQQKTEDISSLW